MLLQPRRKIHHGDTEYTEPGKKEKGLEAVLAILNPEVCAFPEACFGVSKRP
jgi:hypothetical protein